MVKDISVLSPQVENIIRYRARSIYNVPMERSDIEQELRAATIDYCNKTPVENRTMSAVTNTVNQRLFKLIRDNVKFEGCSARTRQTRRALSTATSLHQPVRNKQKARVDGMNEDVLLIHVIQDPSPAPDQAMMADDFVKYFRQRLSPQEVVIFDHMLEGINKPRFVCEALYGHRDQQTCKTLSKHMIVIKQKFKEAWSEIYGKRI